MSQPTDPTLVPFFNPTGIAVVGASTAPAKLGFGVARNLAQSGYTGAIHFVNPRGGRSANLLLALLVFVVYSNMVGVLQAAVSQERLALAMGWWPLHLLAALLVAFLFSWRILMNSRYHPLAYWNAFKRSVFHRRSA